MQSERSSSNSITRNTFIVISIALLLILVAMIQRVYSLQSNLLELQRDVAKSQGWIVTQMSNMKNVSAANASNTRHTAESIREELEKAKQELKASSGDAKALALSDVHRLEKELKAEESKEQNLEQQFTTEMTDVRQVVGNADEKIGGVSNDVTSLRSEVAETKSDLRKAISDYKRTVGDMGVMSGLIATNTKDLETLKAYGDRKYTEFTVYKAKAPVLVESVGVVLKKTDPGRHKFSLDIYSDDVTVAKKDKTVNEPLQFYVSNMKQPYEIVVNEVQKDLIKGYLAVPKVEALRH